MPRLIYRHRRWCVLAHGYGRAGTLNDRLGESFPTMRGTCPTHVRTHVYTHVRGCPTAIRTRAQNAQIDGRFDDMSSFAILMSRRARIFLSPRSMPTAKRRGLARGPRLRHRRGRDEVAASDTSGSMQPPRRSPSACSEISEGRKDLRFWL